MSFTIRILTYNIQHGKGIDGLVLLKRIATAIKKSKPDLVALQEVDCFLPRSYFRYQARTLARAFDMDFVFGANKHRLFIMKYGNAILSRFPILEHHNFLLYSAKKERRGLLMAAVEAKNKIFYFLDTHLGLNKCERMYQIAEINEIIQNLNGPVILAGDFNAEPSFKEIKSLSLTFPLTQEKKPTFPSYAPKFCLDYILVSSEWKIIHFDTISSTASDHLPLIADLSLSF